MLEIKGLDVDIGPIPVLRQVELAVPTGGMCGLIGRNGAGKTKLMQLWEKIFPCHQYLQVLGTHFSADQRLRTGALRHYKATSVTINEGCYRDIFNDMSAAK